jgi:hypothetical protein
MEDEDTSRHPQEPKFTSEWEDWIRYLSVIMHRAGLPCSVNKATNAKVSPFVKLVRLLQSHMPTDIQRHMHSDDALGQAIVRARKADCKQLDEKDVRTLFALVLQASGRREHRAALQRGRND